MSGASENAATDRTSTADRPNKRARPDRDADESKDSGSDQPTHSAAHVAPVTRLYRHALESVFGFLDLDDLSRVLSVSRSWSAAVRSMASIEASVSFSGSNQIFDCAASPLARHVGEVGRYYSVNDPGLSSGDLFILSRVQLFGSLTSLSCCVKMAFVRRVFFGAALESLTLQLNCDMQPSFDRKKSRPPFRNVGALNDVIVVLSRLPKLTDLTLTLPEFFPALSFAPLAAAAAAQLQDLTLYNRSSADPTHQQLDQLRMIPQLRKISIPRLSDDGLAYLIRAPHSRQWQEIHRADN